MPDLANTDKPLRIGLAGLGTVGGGLVELLEKNATLIRRRTGRNIELVCVLVRNLNKPRSVELPDGCLVTANPAELVDNPDIDVVVELMGGIDAARSLIEGALRNGKHVVTANKALLAEEGIDLLKLAKEKNRILRYEAAVAGAVPIIEALRVPLAGQRLLSVQGILNGTSNYILSEMSTSGLDFDTALKQAQELGYAEADPTLDIDGQDAAHKLTLLIRLAFGVNYPYTVLPVQGIRGMDARDIAMAREFGYRIKLLAEVKRVNLDEGDDGPIRLAAGVYPVLVHHTYLLARVGGVYNAVRVESESAGSLFFHGRGAGSLPTASVVLGDLLAVARDARPNNTGFADENIPSASIVPPDECLAKYYVRVMVPDTPGVLRDLAGCMAREGISMEQVIQRSNDGGHIVPLVFMTHEASSLAMKTALQHAMDTGLLHKPAVCYRVL
ncbi:MAG: homoserine dehydrogenase [Desulfovibrio sp.]|nr:homoserine dehydrogenase [Desulfovibrio sp.]